MKVILKGVALLVGLTLLIKFPLFFIGIAFAVWGVAMLKKQKGQTHNLKLAPTLLKPALTSY